MLNQTSSTDLSSSIQIQRGIAPHHRRQAAALYDQAFGAKLGFAMPDASARHAILAEGFNPAYAYTAVRNGQLLGLAGFQDDEASLTAGISFELLQRHLGFWKACRAALVLSLFQRQRAENALLMDGIAVAEHGRGQGLGTLLMKALMHHAEHQGVACIRLDVIDTNPAARRLYERLGFVAVSTDSTGPLHHVLGFRAATQMRLQLATPSK